MEPCGRLYDDEDNDAMYDGTSGQCFGQQTGESVPSSCTFASPCAIVLETHNMRERCLPWTRRTPSVRIKARCSDALT